MKNARTLQLPQSLPVLLLQPWVVEILKGINSETLATFIFIKHNFCIWVMYHWVTEASCCPSHYPILETSRQIMSGRFSASDPCVSSAVVQLIKIKQHCLANKIGIVFSSNQDIHKFNKGTSFQSQTSALDINICG